MGWLKSIVGRPGAARLGACEDVILRSLRECLADNPDGALNPSKVEISVESLRKLLLDRARAEIGNDRARQEYGRLFVETARFQEAYAKGSRDLEMMFTSGSGGFASLDGLRRANALIEKGNAQVEKDRAFLRSELARLRLT